jgi:hypothetical protein
MKSLISLRAKSPFGTSRSYTCNHPARKCLAYNSISMTVPRLTNNCERIDLPLSRARRSESARLRTRPVVHGAKFGYRSEASTKKHVSGIAALLRLAGSATPRIGTSEPTMGCPFRVMGCKLYRSGARHRKSGRASVPASRKRQVVRGFARLARTPRFSGSS